MASKTYIAGGKHGEPLVGRRKAASMAASQARAKLQQLPAQTQAQNDSADECSGSCLTPNQCSKFGCFAMAKAAR